MTPLVSTHIPILTTWFLYSCTQSIFYSSISSQPNPPISIHSFSHPLPPFPGAISLTHPSPSIETAIPWSVFKASSFSITFATESGKPPQCDSRLLTGLSATLLGADAAAKKAYTSLSESPEFQSPLSWTSSDFSLQAYDLVFLPGGHDKGVRQIIDSADVARLLGEYWPLTRGTPGGRPRGKKTVGAICHGVQVLSMATEQGSGKSVLHDAKTTALPGFFEGAAFQATRLFLGDYYKTYGYGSQNVEDVVKGKLDDPATQWVGSRSPTTP